jgi:hypothetical protein
VTLIRDLIAATDEVSAGNLDVRVNVDKQHGELAASATSQQYDDRAQSSAKPADRGQSINDERRIHLGCALRRAGRGYGRPKASSPFSTTSRGIVARRPDGQGLSAPGGVGLAGDRPILKDAAALSCAPPDHTSGAASPSAPERASHLALPMRDGTNMW